MRITGIRGLLPNNGMFSNVSFTRTQKEHKSWGAVVDKDTKDVSFKIFTFPNIEKAYVTIENQDNKVKIPLVNKGEGVFETQNSVQSQKAKAGDKYFYTLIDSEGNSSGPLKDPYSFRQDEFMKKSVIYDQNSYKWKDAAWFSKNKSRVSRLANKRNNLLPVSSLRIYELNIATFTKGGSYKSAQEALSKIKNLGFNAIEIMPVENTYSFNWGYDGVDKFAPSKTLGTPDELKELIDYAHNLGLNVIMDMVPNHLGPDGAELHRFGPYIKGDNDFGSAFNFEGENSKYVRDYMVNAALNWLDNYHCDGLRLDMTKYMESDFTMKQLAQEVNYHKPDAILIAEDARCGNRTDGNNIIPDYTNSHDDRITYPLKDFEIVFDNEEEHAKRIDSMSVENTNYSRLGYDSEWDFPYYHALESIRNFNFDETNPDIEQAKSNMLDSYMNAVISSQSRVKYVMSHDEIGNNSGTRLISKILTNKLNLKDYVNIEAKDKVRILKLNQKGVSNEDALNRIIYQKADMAGEKLAKWVQNERLLAYKDSSFKTKFLPKIGLKPNDDINIEKVFEAYREAFDKTKVLFASTYAIPGVKMVFQGDEKATITPFRFFREFQDSSSDNNNLEIEKGYKAGRSALLVSTLDNHKTRNEDQLAFEALISDLNRVNDENPCLNKGYIAQSSVIKHPFSGVAAYSIKDDETQEELFVVLNFSNKNYSDKENDKYDLPFPKGDWREILNTDSEIYNGGNNINPEKISSNGEHVSINLGKNSCQIFKKVL